MAFNLAMVGAERPDRIRARRVLGEVGGRPVRADQLAAGLYLAVLVVGFRYLPATRPHPWLYLALTGAVVVAFLIGFLWVVHAVARVTTVRSVGTHPLIELPPGVWLPSPHRRGRYVAVSHQVRLDDATILVAFSDGTTEAARVTPSRYVEAFQARTANGSWEPASLGDAHLRRLAAEIR